MDCNALHWWFSPGTPVSATNKTDRHDVTEILLKVALNTINQLPMVGCHWEGYICHSKLWASLWPYDSLINIYTCNQYLLPSVLKV
jgi:hypothetical protein